MTDTNKFIQKISIHTLTLRVTLFDDLNRRALDISIHTLTLRVTPAAGILRFIDCSFQSTPSH